MTNRKRMERKDSTSSEVNRYLKRREKLISELENESFVISDSEQSTVMSNDSILMEYLKRKPTVKVKRRLFQTDLNNVDKVKFQNSGDSPVRHNLLKRSNSGQKIINQTTENNLIDIPEQNLKNCHPKELSKTVDQPLIKASFRRKIRHFRKNRFKPLENVRIVKSSFYL